jgi:hypothetical protein
LAANASKVGIASVDGARIVVVAASGEEGAATGGVTYVKRARVVVVAAAVKTDESAGVGEVVVDDV